MVLLSLCNNFHNHHCVVSSSSSIPLTLSRAGMIVQAPLPAPSQVFPKQQCGSVAQGAVVREHWQQQGLLMFTAHRIWWHVLLTCQPPFPCTVQPPFLQIQVLRWVLSISLEGSFTMEEIAKWFEIRFLFSIALTPSAAACPINTPGLQRLLSKAQENFNYSLPSLNSQSAAKYIEQRICEEKKANRKAN